MTISGQEHNGQAAGDGTSPYVLALHEVGRTDGTLAGGKAAHLGALARLEGIRVPPGFCVTTTAFRRMMAQVPGVDHLLQRLAHLKPAELEEIWAVSAEIRRRIESAAIPDDVGAAVRGQLVLLGEDSAYAVRSSATAEDLPAASFAGQHDTYLNVVGPAAILRHIRRCWASLFSEAAVVYRMRNDLDHRQVEMAVVVQQMVFPHASGVLFTADPVTGHRNTAVVEAVFGLGEALVAGLVNPDVYQVRDGKIIARTIAAKERAMHPSAQGGTTEQPVDPARQGQPVLTDAQVIRLAELGRRIAQHFGHPQDMEWCLAGDGLYIVQSRPITTLFPIPATEERGKRVYVSVGHQQMMTDAMKPLGISFWQLTAARPMYEAGGRLFVDVTGELAAPAKRDALVEGLGRSDPLMGDALKTLLARGDFTPSRQGEGAPAPSTGGPPPFMASDPDIPTDPAIVTALMERGQASLAALQRDIKTKSGVALLDFILEDIQELKRFLMDPQSMQVIMAGMAAAQWLNQRLAAWLAEKNLADTFSRSVPHNVTSAMGLGLLDVADAIRPYPQVVAFLARVAHEGEDQDFLDEMAQLPGGQAARHALEAWLQQYGMRCPGEIDITRPRWRERPGSLVPIILGHIRNFEPGAGRRRFRQGLQEATEKEQEVLERLRALPGGAQKAAETKAMIRRLRTFIGYREYPKYSMVSRYFVYRQALLAEARRLVEAGVLRHQEDIYYLTFHELRDVVRTGEADEQLIRRREEAFRTYQRLTPPRVLTSAGEAISGQYRREDLPAGALAGLPVSAGTVVGRARVVLDMADAALEHGDILVTTCTDPSWTPLFVTIGGLVTEVGGLMTHGAVIAREYGLPAVVGVEHATRLIQDGQTIRVHGTDGYVEILDRN